MFLDVQRQSADIGQLQIEKTEEMGFCEAIYVRPAGHFS